MTTRTIFVLVLFGVYVPIPDGLYDALQEDGYPHWVAVVTYAIFLMPALLLAWWLIDRKRS